MPFLRGREHFFVGGGDTLASVRLEYYSIITFSSDDNMLPRINPDNLTQKNYSEYLRLLKNRGFSGEIRVDYAARLSVATDNSIYQVIPEAVIYPRSTNDIVLALTLSQQAEHRDIRFAARGGGTATNGQSLSAGIIIDCSKYLNQILEINLEEKWVRVQPGVVLDQLNRFLQPSGVYFAPEISPSNRATIGGMLNTDACGVGSKILGRTSDHVVDITCVLSNGTVIHTGEVNPSDSLYQELTNLLVKNRTLIVEKFTNAPRTLNGYNLKKSYQDALNLNYLLCGSEGTLAIISECKLKLSAIPKFKKLIVMKYRHFEDALRAREITDDIKPLIIETIDEKLISLARQDASYFKIENFINDADAINLVEFESDNENEIDQQLSRLCINIDKSPYTIGYYLAKNADEIKLLWELRKKSVGLISKSLDGSRRPIPFIEDTAVPPENLAEYIGEFKALLDRHQLRYGMYGHVDSGCVHVRPALDMRVSQDEKLIRELSDEVVLLIKKYNGVMWGEHGKGFRSEYGPQLFGDELYFVVRKIKTLFDPYNKLNPGKIATALESNESLVKLDGPLRGHFDKEISVEANQLYAGAVACNGNGACFNFSSQDVMCPSFKVTKDRIHSPKGRSVLMREWIRQLSNKNYMFNKPFTPQHFLSRLLLRFNKKYDYSHEVFDAMAGCLSCKACANQCPLNVNIPDIKARFLEHYHQRYPRRLRDFFIANTESIAALQAAWPRFFNWIARNKVINYLIKSTLKLTDLPMVNLVSKSSFNRLPTNISLTKPNSIILLQDAFTSFYEKNVLQACYKFFSQLGFFVYVEPFFKNGKPLHVKGFLSRFRKLAEKNVIHLRKLAGFHIPMIGIDPSITLTYREEYLNLLGFNDAGFKVLLPQEFLHQQLTRLPKFQSTQQFYLLSHCTEKTSIAESEKQWQAIFTALGLKLTPLAAGCCGMSGYYGHEAEHRANSYQLFCMDWRNYINEIPNAENCLLSTGYSCRSQVKRFNHIKLQHPLEALSNLFIKEKL